MTLALPLLLAALQVSGPITPTPEDSVWARDALDRVEEEIAAADSATWVAGIWYELIEQTRIWRGEDAAWALAWTVDSTQAAEIGSVYVYTCQLLAPVFKAGGVEAADRRLARLSSGARDTVLAEMPNQLGVLPPERWEELRATVHTPVPRAWLFHWRAEVLFRTGGDSVAGIRLLRDAFDLARTAPDGASPARQYAWELRSLGEDMPLATLVDLTEERPPNPLDLLPRIRAATQVASRLAQFDAETASWMADSLLRTISDDTTNQAAGLRFHLLQVRGHPEDTVRARALGDSIWGPRAFENPDQEVFRSVTALRRASESRDTAAFLEALRDLPSGAALPIDWVAQDLRVRLLVHPWSNPPFPSRGDGAWASFVFRTFWAESGAMEGPVRDSARVALVALLAATGPLQALDSAEAGVATQPWSDRARAEAIVQLARWDADRAAREAMGLKDLEARGRALAALVDQAVAGGRLALGSRLADALAPGAGRVRANLSLGRVYASGGQEGTARGRLREALSDLTPIATCTQVCAYRAQPWPADEDVIRDVLTLALALGMRPELQEWAASQDAGQRRARAWLLLAESLARLQPGRP